MAAVAHGPLAALSLDPLTAVDNPRFYEALGKSGNLPADIAAGLAALRPH